MPQPELTAIVDAREAALGLLLSEGRRVASEKNVEWPDEVVDAVVEYLDRIGDGVMVTER